MLNRIILVGRTCNEVTLRYTPNTGTAVGSFRIAADSYVGKEKETLFVEVVVWSKLAENCAQYLQKGRMVAVEGRLRIRSYDAKDGSGKRYATEVVADNVRFLGGKQEGQDQDKDSYNLEDEEVPF